MSDLIEAAINKISDGEKMNFDHWAALLNLVCYPVFAVIAFFYQKGLKDKQAFMNKVDEEMKSIHQKIDANRDEAFQKFASQRSFEKLEKTIERFRDRLEDVAIAVGAPKKRQIEE